jgi:transcriptional regulator with XRE-family HTH domain
LQATNNQAMKNIDLAKKIKELRTRRGFSQDELAETAQINLRTVQRIESGETEPRGDTLQRLAAALNVTSDELIDWAEQEDSSFLVFLNLSALSFFFFPLLGIIVPLAIWFLKRDRIKNLNEMSKSLLNFQISWCMLLFIAYAVVLGSSVFGWHITMGSRGFYSDIYAQMVIFGALYTVNAILIIINSYRVYKGKKVFYKPAIKLLR